MMATGHAQHKFRSKVMLGFCGLGGALLRSVPQCMCKRILNASAVCIVQSMTAATPSVRTGWCQGPAPGQNQGALRCKPWCSGACKNKGFVVRAPRNFGNFLCPACQRAGHMPAAGGQTPRTPRRGWWVADALKRNRLASQFHPTRPGWRFRHFPARRCRKSSRVHNNGDATLWRKNAAGCAAETEICPKCGM